MKEIRTKVCKKANAYIKSGMNRSAAFKRAWSETYVKAANLQNGDKIMVTTYSNLWREMVIAPATVICVNMFGNRNRELLSEFYGLLSALAVVCEEGTEGDIRLLRVLASLRADKQEVAR